MKKITSMLTILSFFIFLSFPGIANAQNPFTFGGRLSGVFYCTCSNSLLLYIQDYKTGGVLPLVYGAGSNLLVGSPYGIYQLGSYLPGAGLCLVYVAVGCAPIPNAGLIGGGSPGFGTS